MSLVEDTYRDVFHDGNRRHGPHGDGHRRHGHRRDDGDVHLWLKLISIKTLLEIRGVVIDTSVYCQRI